MLFRWSELILTQETVGMFEIAKDMFWKDGKHFRIIGGDLHYFRVLPEVLVSDLLYLSIFSLLVKFGFD